MATLQKKWNESQYKQNNNYTKQFNAYLVILNKSDYILLTFDIQTVETFKNIWANWRT